MTNLITKKVIISSIISYRELFIILVTGPSLFYAFVKGVFVEQEDEEIKIVIGFEESYCAGVRLKNFSKKYSFTDKWKRKK